MKREKIYFLLIASVIAILISILTLYFTEICGQEIFLLVMEYLYLLTGLIISISELKKDTKSKVKIYQLLSIASALIAIVSFIFALYGIIDQVKSISSIIFCIDFVPMMIFFGRWIKYEKMQ